MSLTLNEYREIWRITKNQYKEEMKQVKLKEEQHIQKQIEKYGTLEKWEEHKARQREYQAKRRQQKKQSTTRH